MLQTACEEAAGWEPHLTIAVNLSPMQLADPRLPRQARQRMERRRRISGPGRNGGARLVEGAVIQDGILRGAPGRIWAEGAVEHDLRLRALAQGVQIVTRRGRKTVVILPYEDYERLTAQTDSLAQFLLASPLAGSDLLVERDPRAPRQVDLEP